MYITSIRERDEYMEKSVSEKSKKDVIKKTNWRDFRKRLWRGRILYLMILPPLISIFIFHYIPLYGVQIAFKNYKTSLGIWGSEWVGLKYFVKFLEYPYFSKIMWNTLWISLISLMLFPIPIVFAIMLNEMGNEKLKKICQTITYAPYFVSTVVVCSMITMFLSREGLINIILGFFGGEVIDFMSIPSAFAPIYSISGLWQSLGWGTIIYTATLAGVSSELIEAAKIDGATRLQVIWHVYLPHLKPTIITMFILRMGSLLSVGFEKTFLLQNDLNRDASSIISTYTYEMGILGAQFSYSAAIGLFNNIINIIMIILANTISKKVTKTGLW